MNSDLATFLPLVFTPAGHDDASLAIAASRAGAVGVFNAELGAEPAVVAAALDRLAAHGRGDFGLRCPALDERLANEVLGRVDGGLRWLILDPEGVRAADATLNRFRERGGTVLAEVSRWSDEDRQGLEAIDGWVVKGHEAGGVVGEETTFILVQKALEEQELPVFARGGMGLHSAAACFAAGCAGAVFDSQLLLMRESPLADTLRPLLKGMVGNETVLVGDETEGRYFRVLDRPGFAAVKQLRADAPALGAQALRDRIATDIGWDDPRGRLMPLGQDAAFATPWAKRFGTVGNALRAVTAAAHSQLAQADSAAALAADSPLARAHGTRYPIVQGPMTRVSDSAAFAGAVADEGGLPMLALALMRGPAVRRLLEETAQRLGDRPWGIGLLGFAPTDLLNEQVAVTRDFKPAFALIAGGRPDQALEFEKSGVPSYLHVPSPRLLSMFLEQGARRFVFEGRECGGHVGPLSSFVLWESMVDTLLAEVRDRALGEQIHVLFAGGIHDTRSAAMVAALSAPLSAIGVKIGVLMGSAYLFTRDIVDSGAIVPAFQGEAIACRRTVNLETGTGHASRCADTPFAHQFFELKRGMQREGKSADEIREALEALNLGRLRLASKGRERGGEDGALREVDEPRQRAEGMYMIGQVATTMEQITTVADLHQSVTDGACDYLRARAASTAAAEPVAGAPRRGSADIAIIGVGALLPGADDAHGYWENILDAVDGITEIPPHRWDWRLYFDPDRNAPDKIYSKWGGFLADVEFDPLRYGMPPKAIKAVDPMQLMTLEVVRQTLEDAGYGEREFDRSNVSLILGASGGAGDVGAQYAVRAETTRFAGELDEDVADRLPTWTEDSFAGILLNVAAGRSANRFDFGGVNFTVDAACASSLTAIYQAVAELEDGRSDMVIAGGVDTVQGPFGYLCFSKTQALSPRGRCSTFDQDADGIVISEGIAMVALKRLADAERDGDRIYAVIKGAGGSSDGRARSMTAPHPDGQVRALVRAYDKAGYSPATVGLFEAHGTGTVAGDTAELETVTRMLSRHHARPKQSAIGSVKTLIGHTKATAGVAGLIKSALALHHRTLPPHANVTRPNQRIADADSPLYLLREAQPWVTDPQHPRRAAVSAFGFGGTNFHVTLEEYQGDYLPSARAAPRDKWPAELLLWRGADRTQLAAQVRGVHDGLAAGGRPPLRDLAFALQRHLPAQGLTAAVVAEGIDQAIERLAGLAAHLDNPSRPLPPGAYFSAEPLAAQGKVAVLFAGQGAQYPNMLRSVALAFPEIPEVLATADRVLAERMQHNAGRGARLSRLIYTPGLYSPEDEAAAAALLTRTSVAQPALGAVEAGLWHLLERLGLRPDMAAGHSYGEYVALYAAGVMGLEDLLRVSEARGRFIIEAAEGRDLGTMAAVSADRAHVEAVAAEYPDLQVANHNAPRQTILSGSAASVDAVVAKLSAEGTDARRLQVGAAFHSSFVSPARDRLAEYIDAMDLRAPAFPVYSNTTAAAHGDDPARIRANLSDHLARPVEFVAEIDAMYADGARIFVGLGPKNIQSSLVDQILADRRHRVVRIDDHEGGLKGLLHGLGALAAEGVALSLEPLYAGRACRDLDLSNLAVAGQVTPPPAHVWLLNGSGARPAGSPPLQPLTLEAVQARAHHAPAAGSASTRQPFNRAAAREETAMTDKSPPDSAPPPTGGETVYEAPPGDREAVFAAYQDTMRQFLHMQESVMLAYLGGGAGRPAARPMRTLPAAPRQTVERVVQFPRATQPAAAAPAAAVPRPEPVPAAQPTAAAPPPAAAAPTSAPSAVLDAAGVKELLLGIVEDRTGYPRDMLDMNQNMEADLGIDSIKRVEIVGALVKALPAAQLAGADNASEALNGQRTLQGMVDWIASQSAGKEAASAPFEQTGAGEEVKASRADLPRFTIEARLEPADPVARGQIAAGVYLLTDDGGGLADAVARRIETQGAKVRRVARDVLLDDDALGAAVESARRDGPIVGLLHLSAVGLGALADDAGLDDWRGQTALADKALYGLLRLLAEDLRDGGRVLAASGLGGYFGRSHALSGFTAQGGAPGLLKSINDEWPSVRVKAVDLDPDRSADDNAEHVIDELCLCGGRIEVGYPEGRRTIFVTVPAPLAADAETLRAPQADWVVLATGGARGITAEVLNGLAPAGVTLVLAGRSPQPAEEDAATAALADESALRAHFIELARAAGQPFKPVDVDRAVGGVLRDREIRANLADLKAAGARIDYRVADVRDEQQMRELLSALYRDYGRIDGVVHGAGIIEDKLLVDKVPESWMRVFDTKVDSAYLLARYLDPAKLCFVVFFASVAGRYGNTGQTDYAAANEVMNRLAWQLHARWGDAVKVAAINWGPWEATRNGKGMVSSETRRKFESRGVTLVPPAGGRDLFVTEVTAGPAQQVEVVAGEGPWERHESEVGAFEAAAGVTQASPEAQPVYPLLAGAERSAGGRGDTIFRRRITVSSDHYLAEHLLDEVPVLPAAAALELMAEAAATTWPQWIVNEVSELRVLRGVRLESPELDIEIVALGSSHGDAAGFDAALELRVAGQGAFYRATVHLGAQPLEVTPYQSMLHPGPSPLNVQKAYRELLFHGPSLQTIKRLSGLDRRGALADVQPCDPAVWRPDAAFDAGWLFDPGIVDSAPQLALVWAHATRGESALPSRFGRVRRLGRGALGACRMHFLLYPDQPEHQVRADVAFVDAGGNLRLFIEELECTSSPALNRLGGGWKGEICV